MSKGINVNLDKQDGGLPMPIMDENIIRDKIYFIRGVRVMLDFDLAELYGYETKNFNRQVKNNAEKFEGEDFMFQLSNKEVEELSRCKNFTLNRGTGRGSNIKYNPYAFTEQGVYMLMTVLKGDLATKQSRALVIAFKSMKDYIIENQGMIGRQEYLQLSLQVTDSIREGMQMRHDLDELSENMKDIFDKLSDVVMKSEIAPILLELGKPEEKREFLLLDGQPMKADVAYINLYSQANKSLHIIDNYISTKTLHLLQDVKNGVDITIFSDNINNKLTASDYSDFQSQFPGITIMFKKTMGKPHDRFIVLDYNTENERVFHCGASSKDAGQKLTVIMEFSNKDVKKAMHDVITSMLENPNLVLR